MNLSTVFAGIAHKELVRVDLPGMGSNQHEINGVAALRTFFQEDKYEGSVTWSYFKDGYDPVSSEGRLTFYDARRNNPQRSEWRLYYTGHFLYRAEPGDVLILVRTETGNLYALVFQANSGWLRSARILFGLDDIHDTLEVVSEDALEAKSLVLVGQLILEQLGLDILLPSEEDDESLITKRFGNCFPSTRDMSDYARSLVDVEDLDADDTLMAWLSREEQLFRALEKVVVQDQVDKGFKSVDRFLKYSLSVQNRRKARMGYALQNHLTALFDVHCLRYASQATTEGTKKPDFLFPGRSEYLDATFDTGLLVMLGAKSTCKERWRQILSEADRIRVKHLCTLEQGISIAQTNEMRGAKVKLVVPVAVQESYTVSQLKELLTVEGFIEYVKSKQITE